MKVINQSINQ